VVAVNELFEFLWMEVLLDHMVVRDRTAVNPKAQPRHFSFSALQTPFQLG